MKTEEKDARPLVIIADCREEDYELYKPLYKRLARKHSVRLSDMIIITDKNVRNLKDNIPHSIWSYMHPVHELDITISSYNSVYILCNIKRQDILYGLISRSYFKYTQFFGYYTEALEAEEDPLLKMLARGSMSDERVACTTSLTPDRIFFEDLSYILRCTMSKINYNAVRHERSENL